MKQTDQYGLNQWDLSDRIRMEDFNADNLKIAAALAGLDARADGLGGQVSGLGGQIATLDGQVSGLGQQLSTLGGTVAGLPTSASLEQLKATLQRADAKLQETKLGTETIRLTGSNGFHASEDGSHFILNTSSHINLTSYYILFMMFQMSYAELETFYLKPVNDSKLSTGCISTQGVLNTGIATFIHSRPVSLVFFPVKGLARQLNCLFFSETAGIGYSQLPFAQTEGFAIVPASGKAVNTHFQYDVTFLGIK